MSSCASHLHTRSSHKSEHLSRCPFCNPALLCLPASPFTFLLERVLNILGMDQGLTCGLGIAPVDRLSSFGSISFGTPTVNRVTVKASCVLQPNTPSKQPNNPSKSLPCPPPFDHDRVGENRNPFGAP